MINNEIKDFFKYEEINIDKNINNVEVTIWCTTYNHVKYIEKALQGFINQETSFNYEVIIFDDASTDGTADIIRKYAIEYPNIVKAFLATENSYNKSLNRVMRGKLKKNATAGKYIALCDGDDYWIYNKKLQRQYELLESNPDIGMCIHNAIRFDGNEVIPQVIDMDSQVYSDDEIFYCRNGRPPTSSFFFRTNIFKEFLSTKGYETCPVGDNPIRFWFNYKSDVYYLDKCWSVRNYMHEGSWNIRFTTDKDFYIDYSKRNLEYYEILEEETNGRYYKQLEVMKKNLTYNLMLDDINKCNSTESYVKLMFENKYSGCEKKYFLKHVVHSLKSNPDYYDVISTINKKKYIYGAGEEALKTAEELNQKNISFEGFVVTSLELNPRILLGKKVQTIEQLKYSEKLAFILGLNYVNKMEVIDYLYDKEILLL